MNAKTHAGDEKHVNTSASDETVEAKDLKQKGMDEQGEANRKLAPSGLTVDDIADQSAYEDDRLGVAHQAANSSDKKS
jgi:hypothetical protein